MGFVVVSPNAPPRRLDGPAVRAFNGCTSVTWTPVPESAIAILAGCGDGDPRNAPEGLPVGPIPADFARRLYRVDAARAGDDATLIHAFSADILGLSYDDCRRVVYVWTNDQRAWWVTPEGTVREDPRPTPFEL